MRNKAFGRIGFSVYISSFHDQKTMLEKVRGKDVSIFTSFHFQEEHNVDYKKQAHEMVQWLKNNDFEIIADISKKTLTLFQYESLEAFIEDFPVDMLRIDYGFSDLEILDLSRVKKVVLNASTLTQDSLEGLKGIKGILACHNYYPRPETGLSESFFIDQNRLLKSSQMPIMAFVPGSNSLRGPLYEGLPTIEKHRYTSPYISILDMLLNYQVDQVFVGDMDLETYEMDLIRIYMDQGLVSLPVTLEAGYDHLYDCPLTIRLDSGAYAFRILESREYSSQNPMTVSPGKTVARTCGTITMDNSKYGRYVGEIQILHDDLPADHRVNVVGKIEDKYLPLTKMLKGGCKIKFVRSSNDIIEKD